MPRVPSDNRYVSLRRRLKLAPPPAAYPPTAYPPGQPPTAYPPGQPAAAAPTNTVPSTPAVDPAVPSVLLGEPEDNSPSSQPAKPQPPRRDRWSHEPARQEPPRQEPLRQEPSRQDPPLQESVVAVEGRAGRSGAAGLLASMLALPEELKPAGARCRWSKCWRPRRIVSSSWN